MRIKQYAGPHLSHNPSSSQKRNILILSQVFTCRVLSQVHLFIQGPTYALQATESMIKSIRRDDMSIPDTSTVLNLT